MLRTLHSYIWRDLLRVAGLALIAFTVVIAIFVIIDKARVHSLSASETLFIFGLTLPIVLTLTLPIAALFAATIVYGRFGQDNELMACRASGINTLTLLEPALMLGAVITVVCLGLNSFVAPKLAVFGELALRAGVRDIAFHALKKDGFRQWKNYIIYADRVLPEQDRLTGVIVLDRSDPKDLHVLVASDAKLDLTSEQDKAFAQINLTDLTVFSVQTKQIVREAFRQTPPIEMPSEFEYKPAFFDWKQLLSIRRDPSKHPSIRKELVSLRRKLCKVLLAEQVVADLTSPRGYTSLTDGKFEYQIRAGAAVVDPKGRALLAAKTGPGGQVQSVEITVLQNSVIYQRITSSSGEIEAIWLGDLPVSEKDWLVKIEMPKTAMVYDVWGDSVPRRREGWKYGQLELPGSVLNQLAQINLADVFETPEKLTRSGSTLDKIAWRRNTEINRLLGKVTAEIHGRLAYGLSCLLLVPLGATLGLIFRDGQTISAFALSIAPASGMILLIYMGRRIIENPEAPEILGLAAIWGSSLALAIIDVIIYWRLARR